MTARSTVAFLAGSHDIGKANPFFQAKAVEHRSRLSAWKLMTSDEPHRHGQATYALLRKWIIKELEQLPRIAAQKAEQIATPVASAVGGHHGHFFMDSDLSPLEVKDDPWKSEAFQVLDLLHQVFPVSLATLRKQEMKIFVGWLSGFVTVADWIGSHERMVIFQSEVVDLRHYVEGARLRASAAVRALGLESPAPTAPLALPDLLPVGAEPNALQRVTDDVARSEPQLTIIEAPTGEGKTECALLLAESSRAEGRGLYVALPTMATANGLIDRIDRYLQRAYPEGDRVARLLHSGAWLMDRPGKKVADPGDGEAAPEAEDWFATSKRGLLDPVGAGTIDQMLLAFLSAKHFFVRLYALAGKTIIIDEVHAYDAYMQGILEIGLAWMRALDCRVILLSATLPAAKLQQLLNAWGAKEANLCPYPRITTVRGDGMSQAQTFAVSHRKPLQVQPLASQEDEALETAVHQLVEQVLESSGTGVLVVNTVSRAQAALEIARTLPLAAPVEVHLFHARFTKEDRQRIEKTCLDTFGKVAPRGTPRLLIATQVVEQSLDLDFDFMISDLAPVDLLIQRAGRLHRHARTRKGELLTLGHQDERPDPTLFVLVGAKEEFIHHPIYDGRVLQRTREWLGEGQLIAIPADIESAIEAVYADLSPSHQDERGTEKAAAVVIPRPDANSPVTMIHNDLSEDAPDARHALAAKTRLENLPSVDLVVWPEDKDLPASPLSHEDKQKLVMATVRVALNPGWIAELDNLPEEPSEGKVRALRHARLMRTDRNGECQAGTLRLHYSAKSGLSWEKQQ